MERNKIIKIIKDKFDNVGNPTQISLLKGDETFKAKYFTEGINVDNLGNKDYLPWIVFTETVALLEKNGGVALKGNAMNSKLGEDNLSINSIEGYIANYVYGYQIGDIVFRRITPISCILIWAGICANKPNELVLL